MDEDHIRRLITGFEVPEEVLEFLTKMREERQSAYSALDSACAEANELIMKAHRIVDDAKSDFVDADRDFYSMLRCVEHTLDGILKQKTEAYRNTSVGIGVKTWISDWHDVAEVIGGQDVEVEFDGSDFMIGDLDDPDLPEGSP